jgi:two-component system OmpR family sensor kinase
MLTQIEAAFDERRRSEDRLRRFVGDASHELRTPLTAVRGFAELFRRGAATRPADLALAMDRIEAELVADHALLHPGWPMSFVGDRDGEVVADELRIRQAVGNLLSNARSHTPEGTEVVVRLTSARGERRIDVEDSGPGVPEEHLEDVFDRFFRIDPSRARSSGGSGLGLSIAAAIAAVHGGRAEAFLRPGGGTTFRIALPVGGPAGDPTDG